MPKRRYCTACINDNVPNSECYPVACCGCYVCEDIVAEEEGYPIYRPADLNSYTVIR